MPTLYARMFALPTMPTSLASWGPSNSPCLPVTQRPELAAAGWRAGHVIKPQRPKPRHVVRSIGENFPSKGVLQDFERLHEDLDTVFGKMEEFPDLDMEGQRACLQQADAWMEQFQALHTRLESYNDPLAMGMKAHTQQLLGANMPLEAFFEARHCSTILRSILEEEERTADPETLQLLRDIARSVVAGPEGDVEEQLQKLEAAGDLTPDEMQAYQEPSAMDAISEVLENPLALLKYRDQLRCMAS